MQADPVAQLPVKSIDRSGWTIPRWLVAVILLGFYLTLRGYHSRDGDQAYRLPLFLHQQSPSLYRDDPFVRAFDRFNPHRGAFLVLGAASWPLGLSFGLFLLFVMTFALTFRGVDRLARETWPGAGTSVGSLAFVLFLVAKAGNIGTNHLFESMLLDRLQAFALGWIAIAGSVRAGDRWRRWIAPACLGVAALIHPSVGLQLALALASAWFVWAIASRWTGVGRREAIGNAVLIGISVVPGLLVNGGSQASLFGGLTPDEYWTLAVELQSPQHMLPHLWRRPQWLAWFCYLVLAGVALVQNRRDRDSALGGNWVRLVLLIGVILLGLAVAWVGIEVRRDVRITVFQPFRMATIARGLALILISGHVLRLWRQGKTIPRLRAALIPLGLAGDWLMVVATAVELVALASAGLSRFGSKWVRSARMSRYRMIEVLPVLLALGLGLRFLGRHDTESGHIPLMVLLALFGALAWRGNWVRLDRLTSKWVCSVKRVAILALAAWTLPILSTWACLATSTQPWVRSPFAQRLTERTQFGETPIDDIERLGAWCRANTPELARFIGPPGPKTFRLWSRRSLAFNRAASPYDGAGLTDWFSRFREHVGSTDSPAEFVREYIRDRHGIEARYQGLDPIELAGLAARQGATHVVAARGLADDRSARNGPLEFLHAEGAYAVYRIRPIPRVDQLARSGDGDGVHRQR